MSKATNWLTALIVLSMILGMLFGQFVLHDAANPIDGSHWSKSIGDLVLIRPLLGALDPRKQGLLLRLDGDPEVLLGLGLRGLSPHIQEEVGAEGAVSAVPE